MERISRKLEDNLSLLIPYFAGVTALREDAESIGQFLAAMLPVQVVGLARLADGECREVAAWSPLEGVAERTAQRMKHTACSCDAPPQPASGAGTARLLGLDQDAEVLLYTVRYDRTPCGLLAVCRAEPGWREEELSLLETLSSLMGAAMAIRASMENEHRSSFVFNKVLDGMKASIYITEIETDRILFMNQTMKEEFGLQSPEGQVCWKVLQQGMQARCPFCPVKKLTREGEENPVVQWDEINSVNGRSYRNYDSLIRWMDGSLVHLQQSIDVTELKTANTDELTQLLTRRPGKSALQETLERARGTDQLVTVCLYDINHLKEVNDRFGHAEGDKLISAVAWAVREILTEGEYAFRLSGDEFVVAFLTGQKNAQQRLEGVCRQLKALGREYEVGFCYGLAEVLPNRPITAEEALYLADERMYEQKRRFHIMRNEHRFRRVSSHADPIDFQYATHLLYDALVQSTDEYPFICNLQTGIFRYAPAMVEEFDLPGEVLDNAAAIWGARVHEADRPAFLEANQEIADGRAAAHCVEYRAKNRKGEWVWVRCRGRVEQDEDGQPAIFAGFITNLDKRNKIDHLTGLFNKLEFEDQIRHLSENASGGRFGVMLLGIDDLKHINDLYDRTFGDEVIRIASQRLQALLPNGASVYRLDGDEFGIIARGVSVEGLQRLYHTVNYSFENQQEYDGKKYYCTLSGGCVCYPEDAVDYLGLMKCGGYALEYAKKHGKKCCIFYSPGILDHRARALEMVEALRESVENNFEGFSLRYQPLVEAATGRLIGVEALARWQCDRFGQVSPVEFIPLLEQTGMILPMGKWVLATAVHCCKRWQQAMPDFVLDVNLSYLQIRGADFVPFLISTLREAAYPAHNLVLELTESHFAQENQHVSIIFEQIRRLGVRIAMDDFGTGYSTLGLLKETPADIVKIDKTFIRDIRTSNFDATFIRFVVELCHDVGIEVCLEGVETEEEYQIVNKMGLDSIQGFLFGRPLTEEEFDAHYHLGEK